MSKKDSPASIYTAVRIPPELRERAREKAQSEGRNLSNYIRFLIQRDLKKAGMIKEGEGEYKTRRKPSKK